MAEMNLTDALEAAFADAKNKKAVISILFAGAREPRNFRGDHILAVSRFDGGVMLRVQATDGEEQHIIAAQGVAHVFQTQR